MTTKTDKLEMEHLTDLVAGDDPEPTIPFGDWLVRRGLIDRGQLFTALNLSYKKGFRVGDALVVMDALPRIMVEQEAQQHQIFRSFARSL
jgi:hypothetical protein